MTRAAIAILLSCLLALPARADGRDDWHIEIPPEAELSPDHSFRLIPLSRAAELVSQRFQGRLVAVKLVPPTPVELAHGVELVQEMRLLSPKKDIILIRMDAHTGDFLEVAGAGLTQARRRKDSQ